jgi:hipA-like C-terminal domain
MYNGFKVTDNMKNGKAYGGNRDKFGITVDNECYIVKQGEYESNIYSEYVASRFIEMTEVPVQEVWIGYYKEEKVAIIKDFTSAKRKLRSYESTRQSSEGTTLEGKEYTYDDVCYMIIKHKKMSDENKADMLRQFWEMYILDAILGNRDRHRGNWGYIESDEGYEPAPLYDNEGSLFTDISRKMEEYKECIGTEAEKEFISDRVEKFPASLFRVRKKDGTVRRTNYYEEIGKITDGIQYRVLENVRKNVTVARIMQMMNKVTDIKEIPKEYRRFYKVVTGTRYAYIIQRKGIDESFNEVMENIK